MCGVSKMMPPGSVQCLLVLFFINVIEYGLDIETGVDVVTAQGMLTHLLLALTGLLTRRRLQRAARARSEARAAQGGTVTLSPARSARIQALGRRSAGEELAPRLLEGVSADAPLGVAANAYREVVGALAALPGRAAPDLAT